MVLRAAKPSFHPLIQAFLPSLLLYCSEILPYPLHPVLPHNKQIIVSSMKGCIICDHV